MSYLGALVRGVLESYTGTKREHPGSLQPCLMTLDGLKLTQLCGSIPEGPLM